MFGKFAGKKTYIVAALTVLSVWAAFFTGSDVAGQAAMDLPDTIQLTVTAILVATLRHGLASPSTPGT